MTTHWRGLAMVLSADRAVIGPEAARLVLSLIGACERTARRDGIGLPPALRELRDTLSTVAMAVDGHSDVRISADLASWSSERGIAATEAAQVLGLSARHTRRLAASGAFGATRRRHGRCWLLDEAEVNAYASRKGESE